MPAFTTIGQYACVLDQKDWNSDSMNLISKIASHFFILKQHPFVFVLRPRFKNITASKDAFGTLDFGELDYFDGTVNQYCTICPNKLKKELQPDQKLCKPCRPGNEERLRANDWERDTVKKMKEHLLSNGFSFMEKDAFYESHYSPAYKTFTLRSTVFDINKIDSSFKVEERDNSYVLTAPFWETKKQKFRSELFTIHAKKASDDGLCYVHYHDIELENGFYKVNNESFNRSAFLSLINTLSKYRYSKSIRDAVNFPVRFIKDYSSREKSLSYYHIDQPVNLIHIADCGKESYFLDQGNVYEKSRWTDEHIFQADSHNDRRRTDEYYVNHQNEYYRRICNLDEFGFSLNLYGEVECGKYYEGKRSHFSTYNELINKAGTQIKKNLCSVFLPELIGKELNFERGDYARILYPNKHHQLLKDRLGEIIDVENNQITLGFENNFFKETFDKSECIPVKSQKS